MAMINRSSSEQLMGSSQAISKITAVGFLGGPRNSPRMVVTWYLSGLGKILAAKNVIYACAIILYPIHVLILPLTSATDVIDGFDYSTLAGPIAMRALHFFLFCGHVVTVNPNIIDVPGSSY